ncbi:Arc family DNA-binding protein [Paracoccus sp. pheM1]|uniref:Arc family DNA-binding protein n=1 Tax=Paracoccus sp. pheM1 TaxID=2831675 RepID=UPI0023E8E2BF|nr:Arc family DNA-binding protein [Paracoccus sp. pheM1]
MTDDDSKFPSELADRFQVRMPPGMRDRIKAAAEANNRSMNAEIVATLEKEYPEPKPEAPEFDRIYALMSHIHAAETEEEQDIRMREANMVLDAANAPIRLQFSAERDYQGKRQIFMAMGPLGAIRRR